MKSLSESKKVLVVSTTKPSADNYIAMSVIASALKIDQGKEVHIAVANKINDKYLSVLPIRDIKLIQKLPPRKYLLEFKEQKEKVKNLQWNQEGDVVSFFISMEKGKFDASKSSVKVIGSDYETIIIVGANSLEELGAVYSESKEAFSDTNIISIGGKLQGQELKIDLQLDEKHSSVSEDAYIFMKKSSLRLEKNRSELLLAGIFSATKNFKKNISDPKTYETAAELIKNGATNESAQRIIETLKDKGQDSNDKSQSGGNSQSGNQPQGGNNGQNKPQQGQVNNQNASRVANNSQSYS